ncbi:MAG: isocitrate lyase/PEP mutase family protein [Pseudomonadota bacterium]|nr:isocitrate lyase/PEP mutase family protein [Pseudomonadota bacterium]
MSANAQTLRQIIDSGEFIVAPGVFEMISARVADQMGFKALYMTGYGATASYLGLPDAGIATYSEMVDCAGRIAHGTSKPLIADADTGYGGLLNVHRTIQGYEAAGVQGIQIEDQVTPKKCGHTLGREVVPLAEMVQKIQVACDARSKEDTLIIARTDSRTEHGLDEALRRGEAFAKAGADVVFIESPESEEELQKVGATIDAPLLANMVPNGRTPIIPSETLKAWGFNIAIYPSAGFSAVAETLRQAYTHLSVKGTTLGTEVQTYEDGNRSMHELMGFQDVWDFEKKWDLRDPDAPGA